VEHTDLHPCKLFVPVKSDSSCLSGIVGAREQTRDILHFGELHNATPVVIIPQMKPAIIVRTKLENMRVVQNCRIAVHWKKHDWFSFPRPL
jgi:hypothetical protein